MNYKYNYMTIDPQNLRTCIVIVLIIGAAIYWMNYSKKEDKEGEETIEPPKEKEKKEVITDIDAVIVEIMRKQNLPNE